MGLMGIAVVGATDKDIQPQNQTDYESKTKANTMPNDVDTDQTNTTFKRLILQAQDEDPCKCLMSVAL